MSYGLDFINAMNAGLQTGENRRRRNALMSAGGMAAQGDARGGMNALLSGGYIDDAQQFRQIGEQQRQDQYRDAVTQGLQGAGGDYRKQLQALSGAAAQYGDADQVLRSSEMLQTMDQRQRQQWAAVNDAFGALSVGLVSSRVPETERLQRALAAAPQIAQQTGMEVAQVQQMIQSTKDWTDAGLIASARNNMSAADAVQEYQRQTENADSIKRDEERYQQQRRDRFAMMRPAGGGGGQGGFDATNPTGVKASAEQRGRIALSFGNIISANNMLAQMEQGAQSRPGPMPWDNTPLGRDAVPRALEAIPFDGGAAARIFGGEDYSMYETAARTFEQSILPAFAGSAVTESEAKRFVRSNLPRFGDSPAVLQQKAANRARITNAAAGMIGQPPPYPEVGVWEGATPQQQPGGARQGGADPLGIR